MNENASLAFSGVRSGVGGLPQRLVQDGLIEEAAMLEAVNQARERKMGYHIGHRRSAQSGSSNKISLGARSRLAK